MPTFLGLPAAEAVYAAAFRRGDRRGWAMYSAGSSAAMVATFGLASAAFAQTPALVRFGGLLQRIAVGSSFGWLSAVAVDAMRGLPGDVPTVAGSTVPARFLVLLHREPSCTGFTVKQ